MKQMLLCLFIILLTACDQNNYLQEELERMKSKRIIIVTEKMLSYDDKGMDDKRDIDNVNYNYKMIVLTDSAECSPCAMKSMFQWNELFYLEDKGKVNFYFIFSPKRGTSQDICSAFRSSGLNHPIYVDTCNAFLRANPHIPSNPIMHSFLLDENDSVLLVGNPVRNKKIEELFFKILKEKKRNVEK